MINRCISPVRLTLRACTIASRPEFKSSASERVDFHVPKSQFQLSRVTQSSALSRRFSHFTLTQNTTNMSIAWPSTCGQCGTAYDIIIANHLSLCLACQREYSDCAFCDVDYACRPDVVCKHCKPAAAPPPPPAPPPSSDTSYAGSVDGSNYKHCTLCTRFFPPNDKNDGFDCTTCCNEEAAKGNDLFASRNLPVPPKAAAFLKKARAQQQQQERQAAQQSALSNAAATRAILNYQRAGYPRLGGM